MLPYRMVTGDPEEQLLESCQRFFPEVGGVRHARTAVLAISPEAVAWNNLASR